jgi:flagellar M-ring protein FliF
MAATSQIASKSSPSTVGVASQIERMKSFWEGLGSRQRIYLGVGLAITLAVAGVFASLIAAPDYKTVLTGLEASDAQTISAQLAAKKIAYLVSPDGTSISVPADQVDAARLEVASHDSQHSGRIGFEIFDKVSWGQTEFDEKVNYQRALEGELERTIQTMSNIKSARVHLVMATDSVFIDRERGAKASVTLRLRRGSLSKEQLSAIGRLVSGAVEDLKPTDVAIVDADSNESLGATNSSAVGGDELEQQLTRRLISTLSPVVGADRIHATVNIDYETASSEENQEKYDPAVSAPLNTQHSEETIGSGGGIGGVPGTSSNVPSAKGQVAATTTKDSGQSSKTDSATYGVNRTTRHTIEPAGRIRRLTAAVLVDDIVERKQEKGKWVELRHKRQPQDLKLIGELAQAAVGFDSARGDVVSVQNMTFDHEETLDSPPPAFVDRARKGLSDFSSVVRYAMLLILFGLVYLLMVRPIQRRALAAPGLQAVANNIGIPTDSEIGALTDSASSLSQRSLMLKKELVDFVMTEPESSATAVRAWLREEAR